MTADHPRNLPPPKPRGYFPPKTPGGRENRDRIRHRAGRRKRIELTVERLLQEYAQGRAKASCWDELMKEAAK